MLSGLVKRLKQALPPDLRENLRVLLNNFLARCLQIVIAARWLIFTTASAKASGVDKARGDELIVSLTSYTARFGTLHWTLKCLLLQGVRPGRLILWVGHGDKDKIPHSIAGLQAHGLEIRATEDVRSFTKIIPALQEFPHAVIVTADDDLYYPGRWLSALLEAWTGRQDHIVYHRAHRIKFQPDGALRPYNDWDPNVTNPRPGDWMFPTGVTGILYPPGSLHQDVTRKDLFLALSPHADDVWLYWMGRLNNVTYIKSSLSFRIVNWPSSQARALGALNVVSNENDRQIARLLNHYPLTFGANLPGKSEEAEPAAVKQY